MKTALVTGASSGIGAEIAKRLDSLGFNVIITARRTDRLEALALELQNDTTIIEADLSQQEDCEMLYEQTKDMNVSVLINNAGFGMIGDFDSTDLERELSMIDVNVKAVHILTKLFLKDFIAKNRGYILNVASSAGLMPGGPLMAAYYATKAYVVSLTQGIAQELKDRGSRVSISALCPGPVETEFNDVAECSFAVKGISPDYCAECALKGLFGRKTLIVPDAGMKLAAGAVKFAPRKLILGVTGKVQSKKLEDQ